VQRKGLFDSQHKKNIYQQSKMDLNFQSRHKFREILNSAAAAAVHFDIHTKLATQIKLQVMTHKYSQQLR